MDGINQLDLITQRVLSLQVKTLTDELGQATAELEQARKRIAELETPTKAPPPWSAPSGASSGAKVAPASPAFGSDAEAIGKFVVNA